MVFLRLLLMKSSTRGKIQLRQSDKYFLWIHYIDPHSRYIPRNPWIDYYTSHMEKMVHFSELSSGKSLGIYYKPATDNRAIDLVETQLAHYDSEINYVDFHIGEIIRNFEFDKNTLLIITSDHGEEFFEHGFSGHGRNLYQEKLHIPLIVKLPFTLRKTNSDSPHQSNRYYALHFISPQH